jgi:hypothetical protein
VAWRGIIHKIRADVSGWTLERNGKGSYWFSGGGEGSVEGGGGSNGKMTGGGDGGRSRSWKSRR